jgi:hypothetical protein
MADMIVGAASDRSEGRIVARQVHAAWKNHLVPFKNCCVR